MHAIWPRGPHIQQSSKTDGACMFPWSRRVSRGETMVSNDAPRLKVSSRKKRDCGEILQVIGSDLAISMASTPSPLSVARDKIDILLRLCFHYTSHLTSTGGLASTYSSCNQSTAMATTVSRLSSTTPQHKGLKMMVLSHIL